MKKNLLPVGEARQRLLQSQQALPKEKIPLHKAYHRVLAQTIKAAQDRPAFDRSAMDGYAISNKQDASYLILGEIPAGVKTPAKLKSGRCLRIYTGSTLPSNCLAVIPQEQVAVFGKQMRVIDWPKNTFIRRRGEDAKRGNVLLGSGARLQAPELAVLAQEGIVQPCVYKRVRVSHLAMGKELADPASKPRSGQIRDSNSSLIAALLQHPPYQLAAQRRVGDTPAAALRFFNSRAVRDSHVLVISGGAGSGDHDWGRHLIHQLGFHILSDGVDLRPGKPLIVARKKSQTLFVLPGNPVSHWVTWQLFVRPLLLCLSGLDPQPTIIQTRLNSAWKHNSDLRHVWWPGHLFYRDGQTHVSPLALKSSGDASRLCGANSLIHFPHGKEVFQPGDEVATMICEPL
ncbi:MAG: molybdopterin molybdotransferase MoeA [Methylacidiphilales bacterium]|nr:molybdopterin molybdotransferase MoeA [Candidatus Methylacidiphilales bacterium]